jgi:hypothetical protein
MIELKLSEEARAGQIRLMKLWKNLSKVDLGSGTQNRVKQSAKNRHRQMMIRKTVRLMRRADEE